MATEATANEKWAEGQTRVLVAAGVAPQVAERSVQWVLDNLPPGQDPATWVPAPELVAGFANPTADDVKEARTDWYASKDVPAKFKRLLDARPDRAE